MTVQDILDGLQISKGAFYHYFESKQALLEALIEHTMDEAIQVIAPIVDDPTLGALDKLRCVFDTATRWKTAQKAFFLGILRVWYMDGNALLRQKQLSASIKQVTPLVTRIIYQGIREGVMTTPYPDQAGEIALTFLQGLGDTMAGLILAGAGEDDLRAGMENAIKAYTDALERVLGASTGSLHLIDIETLKEWLVPGE
jgi:AcrR family transcriptional regulator